MPESDPSLYRKYEEAATKKGDYERLGNDPDPNWHKWGSVLVHREDGTVSRESFYTSPEITHRLFVEPVTQFLADHQVPQDEPLAMVDLGGASGNVLKQVDDELEASGYNHITPIVVDKNTTALKEAQEKGLRAVAAGLTDLPFPNGSVDIAISRFSLQYLGDHPTGEGVAVQRLFDSQGNLVHEHAFIDSFFVRDNQLDFFKFLHYAMRSDGMAVLVFPIQLEDEIGYERTGAAQLWESIFSRTMKQNIIKFGSLRSFPTLHRAAEMAEKAGFIIKEAQEVEWLEFRFTPEAIFDRFDLTPEQQELVRSIYNEAIAQKRVIGDIDPATLAIRFPIARMILTTEGKGPVDREVKEKQREDLYYRNSKSYRDWDKFDVSEPKNPLLDPDFDKSLPQVPGWEPYQPPPEETK